MVEVILWDNDGVLVDTEELFFSATCDALARAGVALTRDYYLECVMTNGRSVLFELAERNGWTDEQVRTLRSERDTAYAELLRSRDLAMEGVAETLRLLRGKARMGVVTSSSRADFDLAHRRSGSLEFFELIVACEDYVEFKPHPEPYLTALRLLSVSPRNCIAVEDSERGLKSALVAGIRTIVVPNRMTRGGTFAGAAAVLDGVRSLPEVLRTL